jgi:hypothetical protein
MAVKSAEVQGRRKLRFKSFDEVLADADEANRGNYLPLGNWSLGKALKHLGTAMHGSIEGVPFPVSTRVRILGRLIYRPVILYWRFPAGAKLPKNAERALVPADDIAFEEGLKSLQSGIEHLGRDNRRVPHPVIGKLSVAQWNRFHLQHAALHLSFFVPPMH